MTTLEYMRREVRKHTMNYEREERRGVSDEMLQNIKTKIQHFETAVAALEAVGSE